MKNIGAFASSEEGGLRLNDSRHLGAFANGESVNMRLMKNKHLGAFAEGSQDWTGKPSDWSDIRKDCPADSIALYAGVKSDYSQYDNLGFTATCTGGYKVYIDETLYNTYNSGAQCSITWSSLALDTGDDITTPSALKAHKIWVEPATEGAEITAFHCNNVSGSNEDQGLLWAHFNVNNAININCLFSNVSSPFYFNRTLKACTAKNNIIKHDTNYNAQNSFRGCRELEYLAVIDFGTKKVNASGIFNQCRIIKQINLKGQINGANIFYSDDKLEKIKGNIIIDADSGQFYINEKLKKLPKLVFDNSQDLSYFLTNAKDLEDTVLDARAGTGIRKLECYGTSSRFISGLKGLRISNQAPFSNNTPPQINISYTGLDRAAIVTLFNDLPTVNAGQIISITGATGSEDLTEEEVEIAENKGWTITGGPLFADLYAYTDGSNNTIYSTDNLPTTSSELFNSTGTKLTGNPTAVTQGLINCTNYQDRLTITDGVVSGFSQYSYIKITDVFRPSDKPWSWVLKLKRSSPAYANRELIAGNSSGYYGSGFSIGLEENNGIKKFGAGFSSDGSSWDISWKWNNTETTTDVWYYIKPYFTGTQYGFALKIEGDTTWTEKTPTNKTTPIKDQSSYKTVLGGNIASSFGAGSDYFRGVIDLKETYSEIDGVKTHYYTSTLTYNGVIYTRDYDKDILR